ncbi:hypothetical protein J6X90_03610 [Candidatus Saccharibacteria bacterium]|nr:hypothetical protein [Candidatus Saccharibacteria bacterium]
MHYIEPYTDFPDESYTFLLPAANEYDSWYTTISSIDFSEENPITSVVIDLVAKIQAILWKYEIDADIIDKDENRTAGIE